MSEETENESLSDFMNDFINTFNDPDISIIHHAVDEISKLTPAVKQKEYKVDYVFCADHGDRIEMSSKREKIDITFGLFPTGTFPKICVGQKRKLSDSGGNSSTEYRQTVKTKTEREKYKTRVVELLNACFRPEKLQEEVWIGDPAFNVQIMRENGGLISMLIYYLTGVLIEIRERIHDEHNAIVDKTYPYCGEGKTLHQLLTDGHLPSKLTDRFPIGQRGGLAKIIQKEIITSCNITKEEFKRMHKKKKELHSHYYMVVYRPEEFPIIDACIQDY